MRPLVLHRSSLGSTFRLPRQIKLPVLLSLLISSITALLSLSVYAGLQPQIPLFYSLSQPEDHIVGKQFIFIIPACCVIFFLIHLLCIKPLTQVDQTVVKIFSWTTTMVVALLSFALIRILIIV